MQVEGILKQASAVSEWNNNHYQWGKIGDSEVRFVNQDNTSLVGRQVMFVDKSEEQNAIKVKDKKDRTQYAQIGGGKAVELWVDGQPMSKIPVIAPAPTFSGPPAAAAPAWGAPAAPAASPGAPARAAAPPETCYQERVTYGISAVKIAVEELGLESLPLQSMIDSPLLAAVYNSSMYAFKDNLPLREPVKATCDAFNGTVVETTGDEDLPDDIPF